MEPPAACGARRAREVGIRKGDAKGRTAAGRGRTAACNRRSRGVERSKPRNLETSKPQNLKAEKPKSRKAEKPKSRKAEKPKSRKAEKPKSPAPPRHQRIETESAGRAARAGGSPDKHAARSRRVLGPPRPDAVFARGASAAAHAALW
ncbi:conserved hypothetical protein [Burkholderia mallei SAVP1]|nr:conserved hypothetical protein [Burkholderia mallei SAVP1]